MGGLGVRVGRDDEDAGIGREDKDSRLGEGIMATGGSGGWLTKLGKDVMTGDSCSGIVTGTIGSGLGEAISPIGVVDIVVGPWGSGQGLDNCANGKIFS